jgi:hypothetical protein
MADKELKNLQDDIDIDKERVALLCQLYFAGALTLAQWEDEMSREILEQYIRAYTLGKGGVDKMNEKDWAKLYAMAQAQYGYLARFADELKGIGEAAAIARAGLYMQSAYQAYSTGKQERIGGGALDLPAHPGDGSTQCGANCRCEWQIDETETGWDCTWIVDPAAESCVDCLARGDEWNPLVIEHD